MRKFRGAVIESVLAHEAVFERAGISPQLFHNHTTALHAGEEAAALPPDDPGRSFDYPLVQYKIGRRRAGLFGIGEGAIALQLWLALAGDHLLVEGKPYDLQIARHFHHQWKPALSPAVQRYRLNRWLPLSAKNHKKWKNSPRLHDRVHLLEGALWGHLCHLCEGLNIDLPKSGLELYLSSIDHSTYANCYGFQKLALDITFESNFPLPESIGLGQGVTLGFGKVQGIENKYA